MAAKVGQEPVQIQTRRLSNPNYEIEFHNHRSRMAFHMFMHHVEFGDDNDIYMIAQNASTNAAALPRLTPIWCHCRPSCCRTPQPPCCGSARTPSPRCTTT